MDAVLNSFLLIFASEMGDKTQLLALVLMARFKKPWTILLGILIATLLNHALAASAGDRIADALSPNVLAWILAVTFFAFGIWILFPDRSEDIGFSKRFGAFSTTLVTFFIAEIGDKTQLATLALAAHYSSIGLVTMGSTLGMLASNGMAIALSEKLMKKISMTWIRRISCALFILFGLAILYRQSFLH